MATRRIRAIDAGNMSTPAGVLLENSAMVYVAGLPSGLQRLFSPTSDHKMQVHSDRRGIEPLSCIMAPTSNLKASRRLSMLAGLADDHPSALYFLTARLAEFAGSRTTCRCDFKRRISASSAINCGRD